MKNREGFRLFLLVSPFMALVFLLCYVPLYGWIYAFFDYRPGIPLSWDQFAGLTYFKKIFETNYAFREVLNVLYNTFGIQIIGWLFSPLAMVFAVLLNDVRGKRFVKTVQTITTLPNFISWVLVYAIAYAMFSAGDGFLNKALIALGVLDKGINFLASSKLVWLKIQLWAVWKSLGWSAILYFAAIAGINVELYEAAGVDGAGRFRTMWSITIPHLLPTYFVLLVLSIANFLNTGLVQYMMFSNAFKASRLEVLDLYIYRQGFTSMHYPYATAIGMFKTVVGIALLFGANKLSRVVRGQSIM